MRVNKEAKAINVIKSTMAGVLNNLCLVILALISRKLFLLYIGIEYLSVGQIINNVLGILAFSELGLTNSVLYMLYKPIADNNYSKIIMIINTYKRLNKIIGCIIFVLGMICIPFLHLFIRTNISNYTLYIIFVMNLLYVGGTYFCSYRTVLLNANQKDYVAHIISLTVSLFNLIIQCAAIILTHNYFIYLSITIASGLLQNIIVYIWTGRMYPFIKHNKSEKLSKNDTSQLWTNIKSMFAVKFAGIVINNTDNVLVSIIDTLMVGYCTNYTTISLKIKAIVNIFHNSMVHSLGIASIEKNSNEKYLLFKRIVFINTFIGGLSTVLLGVLWNDFIFLWIGKEYIVAENIVWSLLLNFYWSVATATVWMFRDTNGLFVHVKKMLMINAFLNLIISIILGRTVGISGIYFATVMSDIVTDFWYDVKLVYLKCFERTDFYRYMIFILFNTAIVFTMIVGLRFLSFDEISIKNWLMKAIISAGIYILIFIVIYRRTSVFKNFFNQIVLSKLIKRNK